MSSNSKSKKARIIILSITLSLAFVFILAGSIITAIGKRTKLEEGVIDVEYGASYNEEFSYEFTPQYSDYYYIYVDGGALTEIDAYSYSTDYNVTYGYYTYDYCYKVYVSSGRKYKFDVRANSSTLRVLVV